MQTHNSARVGDFLRARDLGLGIGLFVPGANNSITDVSGISVGHSTVFDDRAGLYSGVTAITHPQLLGGRPLPAGLFVGNGFGKFVGATQVVELGQVELPVMLTSTLSAFAVADAVVAWALEGLPGPPTTLNPVVGEVNDAWLCGRAPRAVTAAHVRAALADAGSGRIPVGSIGGGAGACALGFKAGIGTSSRRFVDEPGGVVGVLVQANMGGDLRAGGRVIRPEELGLTRAGPRPAEGSCVVVAAVDRPCAARDLTRLARRLVFALGRVGASYSHGSGDYGLAICTRPGPGAESSSARDLDPLFAAAMDCVEEATLDALLGATTVRAPSGRVAHALPPEAVQSATG
jgi:D-aminopeptidase